jgi:AcrR family transcriptional regulator
VQARRTAILETASAMLRERPVADISLRELSDKVGLAKSNVLRYFDSREAIFLEVLDHNWTTWLAEIDAELAAIDNAGDEEYARETRVATTIASSLTRQPLLCELISAMAAVLERNISIEFARVFKRRATDNTGRLAALIAREVPSVDDAGATHFAGAAFVIVAGLWPYANPTDAVATVMDEMGVPPAEQMFTNGLTEGLVNQLIGLVARSG